MALAGGAWEGELGEEVPVVRLRQLPSVPDLGNLDQEEAQVRLSQPYRVTLCLTLATI